jgi:hypothetical protein
LTVNGSSLLDSLSRQIDGQGDGQPGGNYVAKLTKSGAIAVSSALRRIKTVLADHHQREPAEPH